MRLLAVALLVALASSACTPIARTGEQPVSPEELRLRAMEGKLTELGKRMVATENRDDARLQDELRTLRGEIERLRYDVESHEKRSKELYLDLDRRVQKLETAPAAASAPYAPALPSFGNGVSAALPGTPPVLGGPGLAVDSRLNTAPAAASSGGSDEEAAYLKAFDALKAQKYDAAIVGFKTMLDRWPQGSFADNAWYWLGESYYIKRQYKPALESFNSLLDRFPASPKVPDALFKGGLAQWELGDKTLARGTWARVVKDYPGSNAATLARQRLEQPR